SGKYCYGKTPMQTFLDSKYIAFQKNISSITQEPDISFDYLNSSVS
ncbi:putative transposase, partial [Wolbachia endosymbiont of Drosophila ananassae]